MLSFSYIAKGGAGNAEYAICVCCCHACISCIVYSFSIASNSAIVFVITWPFLNCSMLSLK